MSTQAKYDYTRIAQAIDYLDCHVEQQPSLDDLAAELNLSPHYLQRLFKRWAGLSPKQFLQVLTLKRAQAHLQQAETVLNTTYAAGLSSPGRLHDLFVTLEAVTPGEFKTQGAGVNIAYGFHETPFGLCFLAITQRGICQLAFVDHNQAQTVAQLQAQWPSATLVEAPQKTAPLAEQIFSHAPAKPLSLWVSGTNFQVKVWQALLQIPAGQVCSYGDIARHIGQPQSARAVGQAVGQNPIAYLIPCHRVIRQSGAIGNYRWGHTRKKAMLTWEQASQFTIHNS